jgi:hypothetical protein
MNQLQQRASLYNWIRVSDAESQEGRGRKKEEEKKIEPGVPFL